MWYGSLGYNESGAVKSSSIRFEQINIVHNIGALYTHLATVQPSNDKNGSKFAFQYFQLAAGCFRYIADTLLPKLEHVPPLDLDTSVHETLYYVCLAQAQEAFWQKAVLEGLKNSTVARLALKVSQYYGDALIFAARCPAMRTEWIRHLTCKKHHFLAAAQYRAAVECLDAADYGKEIARLRQALDSCSLAFSEDRYVGGEVLEDLKGLQARIKSDLRRAEADNDMIYLKMVPAVTTLEPIAAISMAKATVPPEVENPVQYIETGRQEEVLFAYILPYTVYQAASAYKEKIVAYVESTFVTEAKVVSVQMQKVLERLNLPGALEAVEKPQGLPSLFVTHINELQSKGGITQLRQALDDVNKLALNSQAYLDEGQKLLEYEEAEDRMMREREGTQRWQRADSKTAGKELWDTLATLREYQRGATAGDEQLYTKFKQAEPYLVDLSKGQKHVESLVPEAGTVAALNGYLEHVMQKLKELLLRSRGMDARRKEYASNLLQMANNLDMLDEIIDDYNDKLKVQGKGEGGKGGGVVQVSDFEHIYVKRLRDYEAKARWLEEDRTEQRQLVTELESLNSEFLAARESDEGTVARENVIQNLEVSFFKFGEILGNLEEARKFYNSFGTQLQEFVKKCNEFVYKRRVEGRNLEVAIQGGATEQREESPDTAAAAVTRARLEHTYSDSLWTPDHEIRFG